MPALVIHGGADKTVPFEASGKRTAEAISGSQLIVHSGAPHGLHYSERARLNADVESWVAAGASGVRSAAE